jgi:4-hydroxy-2-oxoglutarate aldolase
MRKPLSLEGCFPPIPTPFNEKGGVDHDQLASNLQEWQRTPLRGFAVLGSNGEAVLLSSEEKLAVWDTAGQAIDGSHLFIAGTGCESTRETVEMTERAAERGAHAAMVVTPHYYKGRMDHRALMGHYTTIADEAPIPIILYNVPAFTGVDLKAGTIIELSQHRNIIGLKESSGNVVKMGEVAAQASHWFQVLAGSGSFLFPALAVGAKGGVMALASVAPEPLARIVKECGDGNLEGARALQLRMIPPNAAVTTKYGIPGLKTALDLIGMYGGAVRSPLLDLGPREKQDVEQVLRSAGIV